MPLKMHVGYYVLPWKDVQTFFLLIHHTSFVAITETCSGQCGGSDPDEDQFRQAGPYGSTL